MSTASIDTVITDVGFDLLRAAPGHKLVYTRAVCGSGHVDKTQLATLTEITDYVMDLSIVEFGPSESAATLRLQLDNSKAPKEFQLYQIGVLAKLLDGEDEVIGETLVQVMQYEKPDIVRAVPHVSEFVVNVLMGQAETVEGTIDMAAYVSIRQFSSRTVNGKPLSADVTLTGEDIKVSGSDQTTVETALSNKANSNIGYIPNSDLLEWAAAQTTGCDFCVDSSVANTPHTGYWVGHLIIGSFNFRMLILSQDTTNEIWYTVQVQAGTEWYWLPWKQFSTATPPQEYDLPLAEGVTSYGISSYCKTQENVVIVNFAVVFSDVKAGSGSYLFANLPAGFRPNGVIVTSASSWCEAPLSRNAVECDVRQDGGIYISTTEQSIQYVHGQVVFVAG